MDRNVGLQSQKNYVPDIDDSKMSFLLEKVGQNHTTHEPPLLWSSPGLYCHLWKGDQ